MLEENRDGVVPREVFDTVVENLIENARYDYELALVDNVPGRVRFSLTGPLYGSE